MSAQPSNPEPVIREQSLLDRIAEETAIEQARVGARYMPTLTPKQFTEREHLIKELREMLVEGTDYGVIPGTEKPTLLLPGAQKVCAYFGYVPTYHFDVAIEDWTGAKHGEPLFYYRLVCDLEKDGKRVGSGLGSCNSWETKYRYRWMANPPAGMDKDKLVTRDASLYEPNFAIKAKETGGKFGKPLDYWARWDAAIASGEAVEDNTRKKKDGTKMFGYRMGGVEYRIPNENFPDTINTVLKIGKKRSYIDSTLSATGLSQYFTQDLEDMDTSSIDTAGQPHGTQAAADAVATRKLAEPDPTLTDEIRPYIDGLPNKGGVQKCFDYIQDQQIIAGGIEAEKVYLARMGAFNERTKQKASLDQIKEQALIEWGEVLRLRRIKAEREKGAAESQFALG